MYEHCCTRVRSKSLPAVPALQGRPAVSAAATQWFVLDLQERVRRGLESTCRTESIQESPTDSGRTADDGRLPLGEGCFRGWPYGRTTLTPSPAPTYDPALSHRALSVVTLLYVVPSATTIPPLSVQNRLTASTF